MFALVVRLSRCSEPVRADLAAGTAASLEAAASYSQAARRIRPAPGSTQQARNVGVDFSEQGVRYLIRDRDGKYSALWGAKTRFRLQIK